MASNIPTPPTTSAPASNSDPTKTSSSSFIIPGSADAAKFVTSDMPEKFKAFLDAFERANNIWFQQYSGIKCIDRPAFSTAGKEAVVAVNSHKVLAFPTVPIYQYDVSQALAISHFTRAVSNRCTSGYNRER